MKSPGCESSHHERHAFQNFYGDVCEGLTVRSRRGVLKAGLAGVAGLSLPEIIILRRVLKLPLIAIFVATVTVAIVLIGYVFNWLI